MKWLIFGGNGWIGNQFIQLLKQRNESVVVPDIRADDYSEVEQLLNNHSFDRVVSLIGRTHGEGIQTIDYLEQPGKLRENIRDNLFSPLNLALLCYKYNLHFTYLGTGCIFQGEPKHLFDESAEPTFFGSSYSIVKGFTDRFMHHFFESHVLNVRIRMPITEDLNSVRNFIYKITHYDKICSVPNSMTVLPELLPLMIDMIINRQVGTVNLVNPGYITHNEILDLYRQHIDPNFTWKNFTIEEQDKILASKRSNCVLGTKRLEELYPSVLPIRESIVKLFSKK
jgi:3,5-epimerase/4-reductase